MANTKGSLNFISALAEGLQGKQRNAINALTAHEQAAMDKAVKARIMALANSKQFANRGINIIDDLGSQSVLPNAMSGAGAGGLAGALTAPGTESENMMGKKTYTGPSLGDRLSYGLTGALMGGGLGAGYGLNKSNTLAKLIASGNKDLPPGAINEFLAGVSGKQKKQLLDEAARNVNPAMAAQLASGKPKQHVKGDWLSDDAVKLRTAETKSKIHNLLRTRAEDPGQFYGMFKSTNSGVVDDALGNLLGVSGKDLDNIVAADIDRVAANIAIKGKGQYNTIQNLTSDDTLRQVKKQYNINRGNVTNEQAEVDGEYASKLLGMGGVGTGMATGATAGSMLLPGVGTAIGGAAGGVLGGIAGASGGKRLGEYLSRLKNNVIPSKSILKDSVSDLHNLTMKGTGKLKGAPNVYSKARKSVGWDAAQGMSDVNGLTRKGKEKAEGVGLGAAIGLPVVATGLGAGAVGGSLLWGNSGNSQGQKSNPLDTEVLNANKAKDQKLTGSAKGVGPLKDGYRPRIQGGLSNYSAFQGI